MTLACEDLAFGYGRARVGSGVSLTVGAGEVVCLLGPNGGGKSTLFKTLLGLLPRQGGRILIDGADIAGLSRANIARRVAYVPQAAGGTFPYSVAEVVVMGRAAHVEAFATPGAEDRRVAAEAMARVGIAHLSEKSFTDISGGERQLALIARALAQAAPVMVLDEPTANLDFGNQARVVAEIMRLAHAGTGVLWATHDPGHALECADRVALLSGGALSGYGATAEVLDEARLSALYGVAVGIATLPDGRRVAAPARQSLRNASQPRQPQ
jgi:iron complex transport system ATP-binding protein